MDTYMIVRSVLRSDATDWERIRQQLWPSPSGEHAEEIRQFFDGDRSIAAEVLIAVEESGRVIGFAELSIRAYAEGCYSGRVAYLEGWFVESSRRDQGVGRALVMAAEEWGRKQGCIEMGSDTELENKGSAKAHEAVGFEEVNRIICFRKEIRGSGSDESI